MEELKWISELKDIAFSVILLAMIFYAVKTFFEKYPAWKEKEQEAKDKRAAMYQEGMKGLAIQVSEATKASQEGNRSIHEALGKAADKQQVRHEAIMTCMGGILRDNHKDIPGRSGS